MTAGQSKPNQVNTKTLNRTNLSVLPVHLFTFSTDIIHTHTEQWGQRSLNRTNSDTHSPDIIMFIPNRPLPHQLNPREWSREGNEYKTEVTNWFFASHRTVMVQRDDYHSSGPYSQRKRTHGWGLQGMVLTVDRGLTPSYINSRLSFQKRGTAARKVSACSWVWPFLQPFLQLSFMWHSQWGNMTLADQPGSARPSLTQPH